MIALYKKGRTHIVNDLDCTIVRVDNVEQMNALIADGEHFHTVEEVYGPPKPKKPRGKAGEKASEVVESAESEPVAGADEDENSAD